MNCSQIKFYHSGGISNCDGNGDLGGDISSCELVGGLDTLFDTLSAKKSRQGVVDYRCFYIKNTSATETLRKTKVYIDSERKSGSFIDLGVKAKNEVQTVNVSGPKPPREGETMIVTVPGYGTFTVYYHVNLTEWQGRFFTEIRGLDGLNDVRVSVAGSIGFPTDVTFTVFFDGDGRSRDVSKISITSNLDSCSVTVDIIENGSPISTTACIIPTKFTPPACITDFEYPLRGNPIELGDLRPGEYFPIWARRTTPSKTLIHVKDNVRINIDGTFP